MGHHIIGLIGAPAVLDHLAAEIDAPAPTPLPFNLAIIPLGHAQLGRLPGAAAFNHREGYIYLSAGLEAGIGAAAPDTRLLYLETDYFGGVGYQGAVLFEGGTLVWKDLLPIGVEKLGETPISEGLARLGVTATPGRDEFDAVGLVRFRHMDDLGIVDHDDGD
jgi:hypothetical protein